MPVPEGNGALTDIETKTYEIVFLGGHRQRITVPATWKVSFGAIVPSSKGSSTNGAWGLRVWEATDKQRAVYSGVVEFWDISIPVQVKAARKFGTEDWLIDNGSFKDEEVERQWKPESEIGHPSQDVDDDPIGFTGRAAARKRF